MDYRCFYCPNEFNDLNVLTNHLKIIHTNAHKKELKCVVNFGNDPGCRKTYSTVRYWKQHVNTCLNKRVSHMIYSLHEYNY